MDGNVTQFHQKLITKGYKFDADFSKRLEDSRAYLGLFAGEKCSLYLYFDAKTKIVYRVKVVLGDLSESSSERKYSEMKERLKNKYDELNNLHEIGEAQGFESFSILPMREKYNKFLTKWQNCYGEIDLYRAKNTNDFNYPFHYSVHIDYLDQLNSDARDKNIEDDL